MPLWHIVVFGIGDPYADNSMLVIMRLCIIGVIDHSYALCHYDVVLEYMVFSTSQHHHSRVLRWSDVIVSP